MNIKIIAAIVFILMPLLTFGQTLVTGRVIDSDTKKPIKEAVILIEGTDFKTITNSLGYFQLNFVTTSEILIKCEGYEIGHVKVPDVSSFQIQLKKRNNTRL